MQVVERLECLLSGVVEPTLRAFEPIELSVELLVLAAPSVEPLKPIRQGLQRLAGLRPLGFGSPPLFLEGSDLGELRLQVARDLRLGLFGRRREEPGRRSPG